MVRPSDDHPAPVARAASCAAPMRRITPDFRGLVIAGTGSGAGVAPSSDATWSATALSEQMHQPVSATG